MKKLLKKPQIENTDYDKVIAEQNQRITELREENNDLLILLESYRLKESEISDTLLYAKKQEENLLKSAKVKYSLELERIKALREKWQKVADYTNPRDAVNHIMLTINTLDSCINDFNESIKEDFPIICADYIEEQSRLINANAPTSSVSKKIEELTDDELEDLLNQL